ncbi:MAG: hypothetical protein K2H35_02890, partial [Muribaculaceae bacterium]|nr:hypothetical protein [Muribaculaceae bacterium]
ADYGALPECVVFGIDDDGSIMQALREGLEIPESAKMNLPSFVVADSFNRIIYHKDGYTIRLGDTLAKILQTVR